MAPVTVVVDSEDSPTCADAVNRLACVLHGRVVCHPTPGGSPTWLGCDVLLALGKRFDALQAEHVRAQSWDLAAVWTRAEAIDQVFVLRAHTLKRRALERLRTLQHKTAVQLWLVNARGEPTPAQREVFGDGCIEMLSPVECVGRWRSAARACRMAHSQPPAEPYPVVPSADFQVFRATCRRLLDPASFATVDGTFTGALKETLAWLETQRAVREQFHSLELELDDLGQRIPHTRYIQEREIRLRHELDYSWFEFQHDAKSQLNGLTASASSASEALVRLRAAQAAYFRFGVLLEVRVEARALRGAMEFGPTCDVTVADRLRGLCSPQLAAAAALALALQFGPHALGHLRLSDVAPSGTALKLHHGDRRLITAPFAPFIRAQLIHRCDQGGQPDDPLFVRKNGKWVDVVSARRVLQLVSRRLALSIPSIVSPTAASVSWVLGHHLDLSRLPVFPLRARQWASL